MLERFGRIPAHRAVAVRLLTVALRARTGKAAVARAGLALGRLRAVIALPVLAALARRGRVSQKLAVVSALQYLPHPQTASLLRRLSKDRDPSVRSAARRILKRGSVVTGLPMCDRYLAAYRCVIARMPRQARAASLAALGRMRKAWLKTARVEAARRGLHRVCRTGFEAWQKAMRRHNKSRPCFP